MTVTTTRYAEIVLPIPLRGAMTYALPAILQERAKPGCRVKVSLGRRALIGCLLSIHDTRPKFPTKDILEIIDDECLFSPASLKLLMWASEYYLTPPGEVLRHLLPKRLLQSTKGMEQKLRSRSTPDLGSFVLPPARELTEEQTESLRRIRMELAKPEPQSVLLHGITGSGKTEVYLKVVSDILAQGGQALVLVPEIGLTPQLVGRFRGISDAVELYHSALTEAERFRVWSQVQQGTTKIVIATRSGIFLPFANLKIIILDEEHDGSYKQEERFCYHARDLALWRGREEKILVMMGTATPSLETFRKAQEGKIGWIKLQKRPFESVPPKMILADRRIDLKGAKDHPLFSKVLMDSLEETLRRHEQCLLYLNRRGFSPFVLCAECGDVPECDHCSISLTLHNHGGRNSKPELVCHYCDERRPYRPICQACQAGTLKPLGAGTERIDQELRKMFPSARIARLDRDTSKKDGWFRILEAMKKKEIDILIGTQMIAKGHDYPGLTLVGILDADVGIHLPDFRAAERTYQLIAQVSGRAGRSEKPGRIVIQTYQPEHVSLQAAAFGRGEDFYLREMGLREEAGFPPFQRLIEIRLTGAHREAVVKVVHLLAQKIQKQIDSKLFILLGPSACPVEKVRGKYRWHLLIKTGQYLKIQTPLRRLLDGFAMNDLGLKARMLVNVDPIDMV